MENVVIDLNRIFNSTDGKIALDRALDFTDYELYLTKPFITPINIVGAIENKADVVSLNCNITFTLKVTCDRCLEPIELVFSFDEKHVLALRLDSEEDDDLIAVEGGKLDLSELILSDILLGLPSKLLCKEDCKGLCPKCGTNLNLSDCKCVKKEIDPRLAVLGDLLK